MGEAPYGVDAAFPAVEDEARPTVSAGGVARRCAGRSLAHAAWWAVPVLISLAVMLPRLLSAHFGLLDDARTLLTARDITSGSWDMSWDIEAGRFRPGYWLFPALLYALVGQNPVGFFAGNAALFAGTTAALLWLVRLRGGSRLEAWIAGSLFALAGPAIEGYYTLSKGETLQVAFLVLSLVGAERLLTVTSKKARWLAGGLTFVALLGAVSSKETTLVLAPVVALWVLVAWLFRRRAGGSERLRARWILLGLSLAAAAVYLAVRGMVLGGGLGEGTYASRYDLSPQGLLASGVRLTGWMLRGYPHLLPLALLAPWPLSMLRQDPRTPALLEDTIWIAGWVGAFLPWRFTSEYYLLPAALGCALLGGRLVAMAVISLRSSSGASRWAARGALALGAVGFVLTLPNNLTSARVQLAVDAANAEAIGYVADHLPAGSQLIVNLQTAREYYEIMGIYLVDLLGRPDLSIDFFNFQDLRKLARDRAAVYVLSPFVSGKPYFTVRVGVGEAETEQWNESLFRLAGADLDLLVEIGRDFGRLSIDLPAALCPVLRRSAFCATPRPVIDAGAFSYGWRLYEVREP